MGVWEFNKGLSLDPPIVYGCRYYGGVNQSSCIDGDISMSSSKDVIRIPFDGYCEG